jgi:hypothetical protein
VVSVRDLSIVGMGTDELALGISSSEVIGQSCRLREVMVGTPDTRGHGSCGIAHSISDATNRGTFRDRLTFFVLELDGNRQRLLLERLDLESELVALPPCAADVEVARAVLAFDVGASVSDVADEAVL